MILLMLEEEELDVHPERYGSGLKKENKYTVDIIRQHAIFVISIGQKQDRCISRNTLHMIA